MILVLSFSSWPERSSFFLLTLCKALFFLSRENLCSTIVCSSSALYWNFPLLAASLSMIRFWITLCSSSAPIGAWISGSYQSEHLWVHWRCLFSVRRSVLFDVLRIQYLFEDLLWWKQAELAVTLVSSQLSSLLKNCVESPAETKVARSTFNIYIHGENSWLSVGKIDQFS